MGNSDPVHASGLLIQLDPDDNVAVLPQSIHAGETLSVGGQDVTVPSHLGLGHKIALRPIALGEKILKYGAPIGSATADIAVGEHVHLHNMKSDYIPTHTLGKERKFAN